MKNLIILALLFSPLAWSDVSIQDRIATQRRLLETWKSSFGKVELRHSDSFLKAVAKSEKKEEAQRLIKELDEELPEKILMPVVWWKVMEPNSKKLAEVLEHQMLLRMNAVRDLIDHPLEGTPQQKERARGVLSTLYSSRSTLDLFRNVGPKLAQEADRIASLDLAGFVKALKRHSLVAEPLQRLVPGTPGYSLTYTGFIPGNKVEVVSDNDRSQARINWFNERVIFGGGKLDFTQPWMKMPAPGSSDGHIVFVQDPIYRKIREMVDSAQDSVFINIFLFGGTLGGTLAKHLLDQTILKAEKNQNFRVLFLHDYATNYNMKEEMMPVFEYIRDRVKSDPRLQGRFYLMQANIQRHPPGIPFGLTGLIPKTDAVFKEIEKMNTYFESKIDHSKVIVVDANTSNPKAYFGSKNWTDHSGGYYYDDAIYVEGPAAALVQAAYYDDVDAALTLDPKERKWFFFKEQGFSNEEFLSKRDEILNWFAVKRDQYPEKGAEVVRLAEANVDGRIMDVRNMLVDRISKAEKNIYMEQLFIYDKYVNDALIKAKLRNPSLDIKIIADHNGNFGMNGLPNTIFLREMVKAGIEFRARRTVGIHTTLPNGEKRSYHQENHRKITSIDGAYLMGGSSNLNPDTLQGSFREFGAEIFDRKEIARFEKNFLVAWKDEEQTDLLDPEKLQLTLMGRTFSPEATRFVNDFAGTLIRMKDGMERRH